MGVRLLLLGGDIIRCCELNVVLGGVGTLELRAASRTNLCRILEVKPSRRSAIRRHRWTSSTTLVRKASMVRSSNRNDVATSSSLAPSAKVCRFVSRIRTDFGETDKPLVKTWHRKGL